MEILTWSPSKFCFETMSGIDYPLFKLKVCMAVKLWTAVGCTWLTRNVKRRNLRQEIMIPQRQVNVWNCIVPTEAFTHSRRSKKQTLGHAVN